MGRCELSVRQGVSRMAGLASCGCSCRRSGGCDRDHRGRGGGRRSSVAVGAPVSGVGVEGSGHIFIGRVSWWGLCAA